MVTGKGVQKDKDRRHSVGFCLRTSPRCNWRYYRLGRLRWLQTVIGVGVPFDLGSQRSYITKNVAESLALDGPSEVLSVSMLVGEFSQTKRMKRFSCSLTSVQGSVLKPVKGRPSP